MKKKYYYDLQEVLSYNAMINMLIGMRGLGKTYSVTKYVIKKFLTKKEEFFYIRRYAKEMKKGKSEFFKAIIKNNEFPDTSFSVSGDNFYINEKIAGHSYTLSQALYLKSANYPNVKYIIFDEFLLEKGSKVRYLESEVNQFLGLIESIARDRDVKIFMMSNSTSTINPYFAYFDLRLPYNKHIGLFKENTILIHYIQEYEEFRTHKKLSNFGKLTKNTPYSDYGIDNKFEELQDDTFIERKTSDSEFYFNILYNNTYYGVWIDWLRSKVYISNDHMNDNLTFCLDTPSQKPNTLVLQSAKNHNSFKILLNALRNGYLYYENKKIKALIHEGLKTLY